MSHTPLQLEDYFFTRVFFQANDEYTGQLKNEHFPVELEIGFNLELLKHESDPHRFQLRLTINELKSGDHPLPYTLDIQTIGLFAVDPDFSHEDIPRLVRVIGGSMLYSATREYVLMITGRGPWGGLKLPTVNFHGAIARQDKEKEG